MLACIVIQNNYLSVSFPSTSNLPNIYILLSVLSLRQRLAKLARCISLSKMLTLQIFWLDFQFLKHTHTPRTHKHTHTVSRMTKFAGGEKPGPILLVETNLGLLLGHLPRGLDLADLRGPRDRFAIRSEGPGRLVLSSLQTPIQVTNMK